MKVNALGTKTIETERLLLRKFTPDDADDMFNNWASDPDVTRYLTWPAHNCVDGTKWVLSMWIPQYEDGKVFNWAIYYKETDEVIGNISVVQLDEGIESADIGYSLGKAFWGKGIMPEALKAVINFLFDEVGLNRIAAGHDVNNPKSGRVMEKAGMKKEGVLRQAGKNNTGICDVVHYSILKADRDALK